MEAKFSLYNFKDSLKRIDEILARGDADELDIADGIPSREKLTYKNGFYVWCTALFVDMRDSSGLTRKHRPSSLARLYRAYISELSALLRFGIEVREVNIHGDAVWAVYNSTTTDRIDDVFTVAAQANSLVQILSHKHQRLGMSPIRAGIGMSFGQALMVKAGLKGSGVNDVVWMGDVVNQASHLANQGSKNLNHPVMVSDVAYRNLNDHNRGLLRQNPRASCWHGDVINLEMTGWLQSPAAAAADE